MSAHSEETRQFIEAAPTVLEAGTDAAGQRRVRRRCVARFVDKGADHHHKGKEQQAEIDPDEADEFPAHHFDLGVERFLLIFLGNWAGHGK